MTIRKVIGKPCAVTASAAWSADGSKLLFPYGPSILSPQTHFVPVDSCSSPRLSRLVVVAAGPSSEATSWKLIKADRGCSYQAATFDPWGIAAIEGYEQGTPPGQLKSPYLGNAYLVQLNASHRDVLRLKLARGYDGGGIAADPQNGVVLVSESQAANQGIPVFKWVWAFDGHSLRLVHRYPNEDATTVIAEPW